MRLEPTWIKAKIILSEVFSIHSKAFDARYDDILTLFFFTNGRFLLKIFQYLILTQKLPYYRRRLELKDTERERR